MPALPGAAALLDLVIAATVAEAVALAAYRAATGRGVPGRELAAFLGAGLALLAAMRAVASGPATFAFAGAMLAALLCHAWLLAQRWER